MLDNSLYKFHCNNLNNLIPLNNLKVKKTIIHQTKYGT
jgi:hypothetical protein